MYKDMQKLTMYIVGRPLPAVLDGEPVLGQKTIGSGRTIPAEFGWLISLRETNPDGDNPGVVYRARTYEDLGFATKRDPDILIPGIDVDAETGEILTKEALEALRGQDIAARQLVNLNRNRSAVVPLG